MVWWSSFPVQQIYEQNGTSELHLGDHHPLLCACEHSTHYMRTPEKIGWKISQPAREHGELQNVWATQVLVMQ